MCEARAHYESAPPPRTSTSAPTPEAISVRVATKVSGPPSGGPPVVGSALAVAVALAVALAMALALAVGLAMALALAVGLAMALALAVGLAFMAEPYFWAKAAEANSRTSTARTVNTSTTF